MSILQTDKSNIDYSKNVDQERSLEDNLVISESARLKSELINLPKGIKHWKEYQNLCKQIFEFVFKPCFTNISIKDEIWNDFKTDRIDLKFKNDWRQDRPNSFWHNIRDEEEARSIFIECKNISRVINNSEVRQVLSYDRDTAGSFRILATRLGYNEKGLEILKARRRGSYNLLIVVLSDKDMLNLIESRKTNSEPEIILSEIIEKIEENN